MSRIDEALAKARTMAPGNAPNTAGDAAVPVAEFPAEEPPAAPVRPLAAAVAESPLDQYPEEAQYAEEALDEYPVKTLEEPDATAGFPTPEQRLDPEATYARMPGGEKLISGQADHATVEQFRRLAGRLHLAQAERGTRVLLVTSALVGEGKTLTATNLAITLSESYKKNVLLIDADLRRPWLHEMFHVPNLSGLNDGLNASVDRKVPVIRFSEYLSVVTAGRPEADPMGVLTSERMRRVLEDAAGAFDWVIIDTPPVALLTDAHLLASLVDSVLIVVRAGKTPLAAIRKAAEAVGRNKVLGVVLNCAEAVLASADYQYYESYSGSSIVSGARGT
jgi:protein-tyrosine kinase